MNTRTIAAFLAALMFACGDVPADGEPEFGVAREGIFAPVAPGGGNAQIFGVKDNLSSCTAQQPANSPPCYILRGDPVFSIQNQRWLGAKLGSGWHAASLPYVTPAFNTVMTQLPTSSGTIQGSSAQTVNLYSPQAGDAPEIIIDNVDLPGSGSSAFVPSFVKIIPQGAISGDLQEFPAKPGTWRMYERCVIQIDYTGLINQVTPALAAAGEANAPLDQLLKQAIGKGMLACIGLGNTNGPIVTNNTQYTHNSFTRNVYNGTRYFTRLERCLAHYGCAQGNCDDDAAVNFSQLNSGSLSLCGPD